MRISNRFMVALAFLGTIITGTVEAQFNSGSSAALTFQSTPRKMRAEGLAEVAGDILFQATQPGASISTGASGDSATLTIFFNTNLANRAPSSSAQLVNSNGSFPSSGIQVTVSNFTFPSGTTTISWSGGGNAVTITIQLAANSRLVFGNGTSPATISVKGVRVNANSIGASTPGYTAVVFDAASGSGPLTISGAMVQAAGTVVPALVGGGASNVSPAVLHRNSGAASATGQINLTVVEGFSGAFTSAAQETAASGSEVTNGTRLDVSLLNAPVGMTAQVNQVLQTPNLTLTLVSGGTPQPDGTEAVTFSAGTAVVSYEVTKANPNGSVASAVQIPVLLTLSQTGSQNAVPAVSINLSPTGFFGSSIPRFAPTGTPHNIIGILLSQRDYVFTTVEGSTTAMQQNLQVLGVGLGQFNWAVQASTPTTPQWLSVTNGSGSTGLDPSTAKAVGVVVNPSNLKAGDYYGLLTASSGGASNSPQYATVRLRIAAATSSPQPDVSPGGLLFNGTSGGTGTSQNLLIRNLAGGTLTYQVTTSGGTWLSAMPASGNATAQGSTVVVAATPGSLSPGSYAGSVNIAFSDGSTRQVSVSLVVTAASSVQSLALRATPAATCSPVSLVAVSTALSNQFSTPVGWPVNLLVQVTDNCFNPILSAVVVASTPDGPITLQSLNNGFYTGSWAPPTAQSSQITFNVLNAPLAATSIVLNGKVGGVDPASPRVVAPVNAASYATTPVAAGSIGSVFGVNLAPSPAGASLPLPSTLGGTTVTIGGQNSPFFYTSPTQLNVQLPQELAGQASASMVVTQNGKISSPQTVLLNPAQPGLFYYTQNGLNRGAILDAQYRPIDPSNPAPRGSVIQVFGTGYGATTPFVATGAVAPGDSPAKVTGSTLEAVIGNISTTIQFSGLSPGFVGLYQFNVVVPAGLTPGDVPMQINANGVASNTVMLAVR